MARKKAVDTPVKKRVNKPKPPRKPFVSLTDKQYEEIFDAAIHPRNLSSPTEANSPGSGAMSPHESAFSALDSENSLLVVKSVENLETPFSSVHTIEFVNNAVSSTPNIPSLNTSKRKMSQREKLMKLQETRGTGLYVKCYKCDKWRCLEQSDPVDLPKKWCCSMTSVKAFASCLVPEQSLEENVPDKFIRNCYAPGSLVWAKFGNYPWWPGIVDDCPDCEQYYWMDDRASDTPDWYNVVFFDEGEVTRRWVLVKDIKSYKHNPDLDREFHIKPVYKKRIAKAKKTADSAIPLSLKQRLKRYSFLARWQKHIPEYSTSSDESENEKLDYEQLLKKKIIRHKRALKEKSKLINSLKINEKEKPKNTLAKVKQKFTKNAALMKPTKTINKEEQNHSCNKNSIVKKNNGVISKADKQKNIAGGKENELEYPPKEDKEPNDYKNRNQKKIFRNKFTKCMVVESVKVNKKGKSGNNLGKIKRKYTNKAAKIKPKKIMNMKKQNLSSSKNSVVEKYNGDRIATDEDNNGENIAADKENNGDKIATHKENNGDIIIVDNENNLDIIATAKENNGDIIIVDNENNLDIIVADKENNGDIIAADEENNGNCFLNDKENKEDSIATNQEIKQIKKEIKVEKIEIKIEGKENIVDDKKNIRENPLTEEEEESEDLDKQKMIYIQLFSLFNSGEWGKKKFIEIYCGLINNVKNKKSFEENLQMFKNQNKDISFPFETPGTSTSNSNKKEENVDEILNKEDKQLITSHEKNLQQSEKKRKREDSKSPIIKKTSRKDDKKNNNVNS